MTGCECGVDPRPGTGHCCVCHEDVPTADVLQHVRVMHPDQYEPMETWPDGGAVIVDQTRPDWMP